VVRAAQGDPVVARRALDVMDRQLRGLVRLVDDLLDVSRITRGKLELRRERLDLDGVLADAVEAVQPELDAAGHRLRLEPRAGAVALDADPVRLVQVFANLLGNAIRYMPPGGEIRVRTLHARDAVKVSIRDAGIGIPREALARVFEPFVQVGGAACAAGGGLGIGLALVKQLVELHGGAIEARSEGPGTGSEFVLTLPVAADAEEAPSPAARAARGVVPLGRRILVADDNVDAAESLGVLLELMGHEVRLAHDGEQALVEAEAFRPELILLDLGMPRLDGYATARRIRASAWGRSVLVAALTGWGQPEVKRQTAEAGFDVHLVKPVDRATLHDLLGKLACRPA